MLRVILIELCQISEENIWKSS